MMKSWAFSSHHQSQHSGKIESEHNFKRGLPTANDSTRALKNCAVAALIGCVCFFVCTTIHWPVTGDAALMHYMAFAMQKGLIPYKQIAEINLPMSYAPDWVILRAFGATDLAWRLYDLGLLCVVALALYLIPRRRDKFSALWAGSLFALIHARDGIEQMGQRDLTGTTLVLLGTACLVNFVKTDQWKRYVGFGLCIGIAASI